MVEGLCGHPVELFFRDNFFEMLSKKIKSVLFSKSRKI
jgi:hypothetical protein